MRSTSAPWLHSDQCVIRQLKEWSEILVNWESRNKYEVLSPTKARIGFIIESSKGLLAALARLFLRSHRPLEIDVFDAEQRPVLHLGRRFFFFFSDLHLRTPEGERIGSIHRRFGILHKKYDLRDAMGTTFARIRSPFWRIWTFPIRDGLDQQRGVIAKKWGGALREIFTDADSYLVDFGSHEWTPEQRAVIFAAAITIDFDFFEENQGSGGLALNLFD